MSGAPLIYVAGNPDLYPLEYYDPDTQTYQGVIPSMLERFAQEYGYDLQYYQPGTVDNREELAENQQVDLISGSVEGERFLHTAGSPISLFRAEREGEEVAYQLMPTNVSPTAFQEDLSAFVSGMSQEEWTGQVLQAAQTHPDSAALAPAIAGLAVAVCVLLAAVGLVVRRFRHRLKEEMQLRLTDPETGLEREERLASALPGIANGLDQGKCCLVYFQFDLDHIQRLSGVDGAAAFLRWAAGELRGQTEGLFREDEGGLIALKRTERLEEAEQWCRETVAALRTFPSAGGPVRPEDIAAGIYSLSYADHELKAALFYARQCAREARCEGLACKTSGAEGRRLCQEERQLLLEIRRALNRDEFSLYIQFFVRASTFQIMGGEALSRWNHPQKGLLHPGRYIPLLEREGRIAELDLHGMDLACAFLEDLEQQGVKDFFLSCNCARKTLAEPDFADRCGQILQRHPFERELLILEVTESGQLRPDEQEQMLRNLVQIRTMGVRVMFDDFGVGFSSFHDLQECPMDGLKLDKELVDNMDTAQGRAILHAMVQAGHEMGLTILAEGVEQDHQVELLRQLQCDVLQGFRFSRPIPAAEARRRILERT